MLVKGRCKLHYPDLHGGVAPGRADTVSHEDPSTSIPSNGEEHVFHGRWRTNSSQVLSFSPALLLAQSGTAHDGTSQDGERRRLENWGYCCPLSTLFVLRRIRHLGLLRWNTLHEAFIYYYFFFFSAEGVKNLSASDSLGCWALVVFIFLPSVIRANCYFMHMKHTVSSPSSLVWSKSLAHVENNKQKWTCSLPSLMSIPASNYLEN